MSDRVVLDFHSAEDRIAANIPLDCIGRVRFSKFSHTLQAADIEVGTLLAVRLSQFSNRSQSRIACAISLALSSKLTRRKIEQLIAVARTVRYNPAR